MMSHSDQKALPENERLKEWLKLRNQKGLNNTSIQKPPDDSSIPLSFGQLRLWFLQQLNPGNPFYHYAESYLIKGALKNDLFISSFMEIVNRHRILRTTFPSKEGTPRQQVHQRLDPEIKQFDFRLQDEHQRKIQADRMAISEATRPFDLENGPLVRLSLFQLGDQEFLMVLTMHHIITDKWSMNILRQEWSQLYKGKSLEPVSEIQYADFAYHQRQSPLNSLNLQYWEKKLQGDIPKLELPLSKRRKASPTFRGSYCEQFFSDEQTRELQALSKQRGTTMFVLMLSVFKVLLFRYTGISDLLVATPVTNRDQTSLEKVIGFFNETLVLRNYVSGNLSFLDLLEQVRSTVMEAFAHKNIPFETVVQRLKPERMITTNPLFQVMFLYHQVPQNPSLDREVQWEYQPLDIGVSKFDLTLYISEEAGKLSAIFEYATDILDKTSIEYMQGHLNSLIDGILEQPNAAISSLPLLTDDERNRILYQWNQPVADSSQSQTINELITTSFEQNSKKTAVIYDETSMSYQDLDHRVIDIAQRINQCPGPKIRIGICTDRSPEMVIGLLAVLKTGRAYVPLDPNYPKSRIQHILNDAAISVLLTQDHLVDKFLGYQVHVIPIDVHPEKNPSNPILSPAPVDESSEAYVIYTSGSTGFPKGVSVTQKNLLNSTRARFSYYQQQPGTFLMLSSFSFDSSVAGIFWTLCKGGTLVLPPVKLEQDIEALCELIARNEVTHTLLLPSLYHLILLHGSKEKLTSLRTVIVAGEVCNAETCKIHFEKMPQTSLYNEYGPTEATVWSTVHHIKADDCKGQIPIGHPIENTRVYILDKNLELVPTGVVGEIYIAGNNVTSGYINQTELSNSSFVSSPFDSHSQSRLYKTGDLGKYRSDGAIEFVGRADHQVKVRGYRVEPYEIQRVINGFPGILESAVVFNQNGPESGTHPVIQDSIDEITGILQGLDPKEAEQLLDSVEAIRHFTFPSEL